MAKFTFDSLLRIVGTVCNILLAAIKMLNPEAVPAEDVQE